jgi:hypothetical protein
MQFVINELPLLLLCPIGLIYAGMDGLPLTKLVLALTLILSVYINQKVPHISIEKYTTYQQERIASVHKK